MNTNKDSSNYGRDVDEDLALQNLLTDHLIGNRKYASGAKRDWALQQAPYPQRVERVMRSAMDSCAVKSTIALIGGFVIGGVFGMFTASVDPQSSISTEVPTVRQTLQEYKTRMWSTGKNFALIGFLYAGTECAIETYRAKHDIYNSASAGFTTGALLGFRAGIKPALFGGAGFCLFSCAIDYFMRSR